MAKLKVKTNRSVAKRFKITGSGKILHKKSGKRHLLVKKTRKRGSLASIKRCLRDFILM